MREPPRGIPTSARIAPNAMAYAEAHGTVRDAIPDNRIMAHLIIDF